METKEGEQGKKERALKQRKKDGSSILQTKERENGPTVQFARTQ